MSWVPGRPAFPRRVLAARPQDDVQEAAHAQQQARAEEPPGKGARALLPEDRAGVPEEAEQDERPRQHLDQPVVGAGSEGCILFEQQHEARCADQGDRDEHRRQHGRGPGRRDQVEDVPVEPPCGPVEDDLQRAVVGEVPDAETEREDGEAPQPVPGRHPGHTQEEQDSGDLADDLGLQEHGRDGFEGEVEALRVGDGAQVDDHGALDVAEGQAEKAEGRESSESISCRPCVHA